MKNIHDTEGGRSPVHFSLLELLRDQGIDLIHEGAIWTGNCPFHQDDDHSLLVDPARNHWQCDGPCQTGGDAVAWVVKAKAVSVAQATAFLDQHGYIARKSEPTQNDLCNLSSNTEDQKLLQQIVGYYHQTLKNTPAALNYLKTRRIDHPDVVCHFKLGFSDRSLGKMLPLKNRKEGAAIRGKLQRLGIIKSSGHELFRGSVTIPVITKGQVVQIYGRKVTQNLRPGTPLHLWLPGEKTGLFNVEAVEVADEIIICPSLVDTLTFWSAGYRNVTCPVGIGRSPGVLVQMIKPYAPMRVLISHSATPEGNTASEDLASELNTAGIDAFRIEFPTGMDANDYAVGSESPQDALGDAIRGAKWAGKGKPEITLPEPKACIPEEAPEIDIEPHPEEAESAHPDETSKPSTGEGAEIPAAPPLPATVEPRLPEELDLEIKDNELVVFIDQRRYRIRGFEKNLSYDQLKVNLLVSQGENLHVDTFDMYNTKPRANYVRQASMELGVKEELIKKDLAQILLKLEVLQEQNIREVFSPQQAPAQMSEKEQLEAMALLESPDLVQRLLEDFRQCGLVGEEINKLTAYLATLSRKLDKPLAIMVQSTSAAGKSALMDAVLRFLPEEECVQYSAITGQSLFYMGNVNLRHKVLAISEEEGASNASYALKLLQSEGHLTIASTGKDPVSGRHTTHEYRVDGPVMIFSTTTAIEINEELLNRCLVLTVNEDQAQTEAIHQRQRYEETLEGMLAGQAQADILRVHRNAQRLLRPLRVVNPYATQLTFLSDKTRTRRDHRKYLTLIRSIAFLHQYQREVKMTYCQDKEIEYTEVSLEDITLANKIAHDVLGRSLDELPPQTRHLLSLIDQMVSERCSGSAGLRRGVRFTRRDVREYTGWGETQLKVHLKRLEDMEYLLIHRGGRGQQRIYELLYNNEGKDGSSFLMGLMDVEALRQSGSDTEVADSSRPDVGAWSARCHSTATDIIGNQNNKLEDSCAEIDICSTEKHMPPSSSHSDRSMSTTHKG
ncbi:MAG: DNA primase [Candidatus Thiodiazotropha sp. (ex Lucinoma borealis)]|nr:DNA primase [Candidatus Thiodiazotropha sp. (ex Lucinoma borealis)]